MPTRHAVPDRPCRLRPNATPPAPTANSPTAPDPSPGADSSNTLITGPPSAGKSTHVDRHARPGDLIVCFDQFARRAGSRNRHRHIRDQRASAGAAFRRLRTALPDHDGTVWARNECAAVARMRRAVAGSPVLPAGVRAA